VLSAGAIGIGSTLDILIPPSVGMVIYGIMTQTSIGKLHRALAAEHHALTPGG
jgi:TRAP-type C4-dicarboxylate transport system permease large subunit